MFIYLMRAHVEVGSGAGRCSFLSFSVHQIVSFMVRFQK